ncbi:MAG TPA: cupin domain-containing protein [Candidatus Methanofastidiosa archaeon]|nr:cupin domain-containing protein [Candidatus Methanofastidiosa archaeon]HPR42152.1 cupin domain-containing protein [Candidatus Methanofastidiosa archaeon]
MNSDKIGQRIRKYMEMRGMSIGELSEQTGLEVEFLASMQNDDVYPSLGPLLKVARALGVRLGTFLDDQISKDPLVIRNDERREEIITHGGADMPASMKFHSLGRGKVDRHMEPFFIELCPESSEDLKLSSHEGEEFIMVTSGRLLVTYGKERHILEPGDSIYYNSVVPHNVSCYGDGAANIVAVLYFP